MYYYILDLAGVAVFSVSGALAAGQRRMDLVGVVTLAAVTAVGGGTIRDLLLDRHPIFWLANSSYLLVIIATALLTVVCARFGPVPRRLLDVADALGLAMFSIAGTQVAEGAGMPALSCVLLGVMTGSAGGAIRDVLTAQVPQVLQRGSLYATAAFAGTSAYVVLARLGVSSSAAALTGMTIVAGVRLAAMRWGLMVPLFELDAEHGRGGSERSRG